MRHWATDWPASTIRLDTAPFRESSERSPNLGGGPQRVGVEGDEVRTVQYSTSSAFPPYRRTKVARYRDIRPRPSIPLTRKNPRGEREKKNKKHDGDDDWRSAAVFAGGATWPGKGLYMVGRAKG